MPYPGEIIAGTYQIIDEIGKGGAGIIYRAYHLNLQKYVVVKKIKEHFTGVLNARGEVDILKALHHTCLPQVYDFVRMDGEIFTVMDYIEGHDLDYYLKEKCFFEEESLWFWLIQLLEVLEYLHGQGILHLDIKPANIMLTPSGNVCLIDFNISFGGEGTDMAGISQIYASPEQYSKWLGIIYQTEARSIVLDERTDLYSLGGTFYQMMTGCPPSPELSDMTPLETFQLPYSKELIRIISRLLHPDRKKRFSNAAQALRAIGRIRRTKEEKAALRRVFILLSAAIVILTAAMGIILFRNQSHAGKKERQEIAAKEAQLAALNADGEYGKAYQEGIDFINTDADVLDKLKGARQSVEEQILDACMGMENYAQAADYVNELLEWDEDGTYYKKAAIVYAYCGDYGKAEAFLEEAEKRGCSQMELAVSRAELYAAQEDYESAIGIYRELYETDGSTDALRKMAVLYLKEGTGLPEGTLESAECLSCAVYYYELLEQKKIAVYADRMNLLTAYLETGQENKASALLDILQADYPDHYQVYLYRAILAYNGEMEKAAAFRDFTKVREYVRQARELYGSDGYGETDEQLQNMIRIVEELPQ